MFGKLLTFIIKQLTALGFKEGMLDFLTYLIFSAAVILIGVVLELFVRWVILSIFYHVTNKWKHPIYGFLRNRRLFPWMIHLLSPIIISIASPCFGKAGPWILKGMQIYTIILLVLISKSVFGIADDIYRTHEVSKKRPIKGLLQIIEIFIAIILVTFVIANWIDESPLVLLSGIGAFAAVLSIIFKDTLLGFVAGVQLATNDMVHIGDWIEMPKYSVDGMITDISLISVKVENADNTITTVPAYALVSDSFKNWRGMALSGSRRMQRAVYIDITSIVFCSDEMLDQFSKNENLAAYISGKRKEYEKARARSGTAVRQKFTNIGIFRYYLEKYLAGNPKIREDMTILVRQLPAESHGLPLEISAYSSETDLVPFEKMQAEIFEHIYAIAPSFGLRLFQNPSGHDVYGK